MVPIAPIEDKEGLYLTGSVRIFHSMDGDGFCFVRVGGDEGFELLEDYVAKNDRHFKRVIMTHMNTSGLEYPEVVDAMLAGRKGFGNMTESRVLDGGRPKKNQFEGFEAAAPKEAAVMQGKYEEEKEGEKERKQSKGENAGNGKDG